MTSIKRQKTSKQCSNNPVVLNLASLPAEIFNGITSYLPNTSCALLGVSLTAPSSSTLWRHVSSTFVELNLSSASAFILSSITARGGDRTLDLKKDIIRERSLQEQIDDQDIHALLMFINAPEKLRRLNFILNYHWSKVTGIGLQPLHGSRVIEHISLNLSIESSQRFETILPILRSIIRTDGNSLKHMKLLNNYWRPGGQARQALFNNLVEEYSQLLDSRDLTCQNCGGRCRNERSAPWMDIIRGRQNHTCSLCINNFCESSNCAVHRCYQCNNDLCENCAPSWCNECGKCSGCNSTSLCKEGCGELVCEECELTCEHCDRSGCNECLVYRECYSCGQAHCGNCFGREDCNVVVCDGEGCDKNGYCQDCFVKDWEEDTWDCNDCQERFREEASAIMSRQHLQIASLHQEIERLRLENEELRDRDGSSSS